MADLPPDPTGLQEARLFLRDLQARHPTPAGALGIALGTSVVDACLAQLKARREFELTDDPQRVRRGGMCFHRELEERRIDTAEALVTRIAPGHFEDPVYLALMAYQAASIMMALPDEAAGGRRKGPDWSRFLIGTVHNPEVNAFAQRFIHSGHTVVVLHSALIELAYQAAKATVAATHPAPSNGPQPAERLYRTLEACFFKGYPRAFQNETVPSEHVLALTYLIGMVERWVIGHEFGHGLATEVGWNWAPVESPARSEEFFADNHATVLTALSAHRLDGYPPDSALVGGIFALACLDIFQRGLSLVRHGEERAGTDDGEHPGNEARAQNIVAIFKSFFTSPLSGDARITAEECAKVGSRVFVQANTLLTLWREVRPRLMKDFQQGRAVAPMWFQAG